MHQSLEPEAEREYILGRREAQQVLERENGDHNNFFDAKRMFRPFGQAGYRGPRILILL